MKKIDHVMSGTKCSRRISSYLFFSVLLALLAGCDDSSSASAENNEPAALSSAEKYGSSSSGSVSSAGSETLSSSSRCAGASEECDEAISSDSNAESNGSSSSSSSEKLSEASSSSAGKAKSSSSVVTLATPCKTETEDNCEYGTVLDERDNQVYKTVQIGERIWMAENLNYQTENSWCGGGNSKTTLEGDCATYGRLYTWTTAVGKTEDECGSGHYCGLYTDSVQGVCPVGWHVPTRSEWNTLFTAVGGNDIAGRELKATTLWEAEEGFTNEDAYGFSALPAGGRYYNDYFNDVGYRAFFWSTTQYVSYYDDVYYMYLCNGDDNAYLSPRDKVYGFSVRCVKD